MIAGYHLIFSEKGKVHPKQSKTTHTKAYKLAPKGLNLHA
jgi:hypothetical protein